MLHHSYRSFEIQNRAFKGEAWVTSEGESTKFAKDFADKKPEELKADVAKMEELERERTQKALDSLDFDVIASIGSIVEKTEMGRERVDSEKITIDTATSRQGLIALIQKEFPDLLKTRELLQLSYKWMFAQTDGSVNDLREGDQVEFKDGKVTLTRNGTEFYKELEILPWSFLLGEKPTALPNAPTTSAPPTEPIEPLKTAVPEPIDTRTLTGKEPAEPQPQTTPQGEVKEARVARDRAGERNEYVDHMNADWDRIMSSLEAQLPEGITMKVEGTGFKNKLSRRIILSKGDQEAVVSVIVRQDKAPSDRNAALGYDQNVEVEIRSGGKNYKTVLEAVQAAQSTLASRKEITDPYEKQFSLEIALVREMLNIQVERFNRTHPQKTIDARFRTHPGRKSGDFELILNSPAGQFTIQVIPGEKYDHGDFDKKNGSQILFDGKEFETVDDAVATVFDRLDDLKMDRSLYIQQARARLIENLGPTVASLQSKYRPEITAGSKGYGSDLIVSSVSDDKSGDITYDIVLKDKRYQVQVKVPDAIDSNFDYTADRGAVITDSNGVTYKTVSDAIKGVLDTETVVQK